MLRFNSNGFRFRQTVLATGLLAASGLAHSAELDVTVQNLTQGI